MIQATTRVTSLHLRVSLPRLEPAASPAADSSPDATAVSAAGDILRNLSALPAVESVSLATDAPLTDSDAVFYTAEGQPPVNAHNTPRAYFHRVSPDFFHTLHTRFLAGRTFSEAEVRRNPNLAVVTENMVRRFWPGEDPIGKRVKVGSLDSSNPWLTIIGVVENLKYRGLPRNTTADPDLFLVFNERSRDFSVLVRTPLKPASMISAIRKTLDRTDPSILIYDAGTLGELIGQETARPRFMDWLMAIFAAVALALAAVGLFGVLSYLVATCTQEIGIRMALGAHKRDVLRLVVGHGMTPALLGLGLGVIAALALTHFMSSLLYGVKPTDPMTFIAVSVILAAVSLLATYILARRAMNVDPMLALRRE